MPINKTVRWALSSAVGLAVLATAGLTASPAQAVGPTAFPAAFEVDTTTKTITLTQNYEATETVRIPGGYTLDGAGHTIFATGTSWLGPVVANEGTGDITVTDLSINRITRNAPWANDTATYGDPQTVAGILAKNAGLTATNVRIEGIRGSNLNQNGYGILVLNSALATPANVSIDNAEISAYTKGGVYIFGQTTTASITDSTVGGGIAEAATNAVLVSSGATSTIEGNTITGGRWKNAEAQSTGILLFGAGDANVRRNVVQGADVGINVNPGTTGGGRYAGSTATSNVTLDGNTFKAPTSLLPGANTPIGVQVSAGKAGTVNHATNEFAGFAARNEIVDDAGIVATPTFTATPAPVISGATMPGATLTAAAGAWRPTPAAFAYQWKANGTPIAKATKASYTLTGAERGKTITVTVTGSRPHYDSASVTSAATAPVKHGSFTSTPTPTISGAAKVGKTLTAKPGTWKPTGVKLSYQWYRNGRAIPKATKPAYSLTGTDLGKTISVKVTGTKPGHTSVSKTSKATGKVAKGTITASTPKISGTAKVGKTLTAKPGTWKPTGVKLSYQWYRNGKAIPKATKSSYKLTRSDRGRRITVKTTGKATAYTPAGKTSKATSKVAK